MRHLGWYDRAVTGGCAKFSGRAGTVCGPACTAVVPVLSVSGCLMLFGFIIRDYRAPIDMRRLTQVGCAAPKAVDPGVEAMAQVLTEPSPLPALPKFRTQLAADTWNGLGVAGPLAPTVSSGANTCLSKWPGSGLGRIFDATTGSI